MFGSEVISARYFDELWIGGDSRDIAFQLDIEASVGPAFRIFDGFSMKLRPSVRAAHRQGLGLLQTELRFPGLEAGFGIEHDSIDLDWVFHVAPSLAGEWKALESSRDLAGSTIGTSLSWSLWTQIPVRFDLDFTRFVATKSQWRWKRIVTTFASCLGRPKAFRRIAPVTRGALVSSAHGLVTTRFNFV